MNLLGAMAGGMLEYNSMYFGVQSLYWLALGLYAAAFVAALVSRRVSAPAAELRLAPGEPGPALDT
jgi:predicted MFS family arabinose efflux permease